MKKIKNIAAGIITVLYMVLLIVFVKDVGAAVLNSVKVCVTVMVPSLFVFMVISGFVVSSNLYAVLSKPFDLTARYIFRIPAEYFSVFLIGSIGGYPVGAKLISGLYSEGKTDIDTAETMLSYCYLAGPAFICGAAGVGLFSDAKAGLIIFASILSTNILTAFFTGLKREVPPKRKFSPKLDLSAEKLIKSVNGGAESMLSICAIIVFFSSVICILEKLGAVTSAANIITLYTDLGYSNSLTAVKSFIEISNISSLSKNDPRLMPLTAALISFGGVCVLMQVNGFVSGKLSVKRFLLYRIPSMVISYLLCSVYMELFYKKYITVSVSADVSIGQNQPIAAVFLLIMTILLLSDISMEKKKKV